MKTELKAKYLQHLLKNKKDKSAGFTLIELLVVIIIIGILAAIALPSFLSQAAKAKQSEGKQNVAAYNTTQAAFRTDSPTFASSFDVLAIGNLAGTTTATTANYTYTMGNSSGVSATIATVAFDPATKTYAGEVARYNNAANQPVVTDVVCQSATAGAAAATTPASGTNGPTCASPATKL